MIKNIIKHLKLKDEIVFYISFSLATVMSLFMPISFAPLIGR